MRASRRKAKGQIEGQGNLLQISFLSPTSLNLPFPAPLKFFVRKEFKRYKGHFSDEWWDGKLWHRGNTTDQHGLFRGISPELRVETDYHTDENNQICSNSEFFPSEYTVKNQRRRKSVTLTPDLTVDSEQAFLCYLAVWNQLVTMDKAGIPLNPPSENNKSVYREYQEKRAKASGPLRYKSFKRLSSIPIPTDFKTKQIVGEVIDFRRFISGRILKRSKKKYQISFVYSEKRVREVNLEQNTINSCRDPRLRDIGVAFSKQGISIVTQDAFDQRKYFIIKADTIKNTRNFIKEFFKNLYGKVRSIALDASCFVPKDLVELRKKFIKQCRTMKAVGAALFYEAPKLIPLGETYRADLPAHNPKHLKVWEKKLFSEVQEYALIQGLTGEPMLVIPGQEGPSLLKGGVVPGLVMANHTLHQAVAKWDLWPGASFLSRASCRTVLNGLKRI